MTHQSPMRSFLVALSLLALVGAASCREPLDLGSRPEGDSGLDGDGRDGGDDDRAVLEGGFGQDCPLSELEYRLLGEVVENLTTDTLGVLLGSLRPQIVGRYSLLASSTQHGFTQGWVEGEECAPIETRCASDLGAEGSFYEDHDTCHEVTCEGAFAPESVVTWTMAPYSGLDEPHAFSYPAGSGTITYDPNPRIAWSIYFAAGSDPTVDADVFFSVTHDGGVGEVLDLTHEGAVHATASRERRLPEMLSIYLTFAFLLPDDETLDVLVSLDDRHEPRATISVLDGPIAEMTSEPAESGSWDFTFSWSGACADEHR